MDTGEQRSLGHDEEERFGAALLSAFTSAFKLRQLLWYRLGRNLDDFVPEQSDREAVVFELIREANAGGWWAQLLQVARYSQPQNRLLLAFARDLGLAAVPLDGPIAPSKPIDLRAPNLPLAPEPRTRPGALNLGAWSARLGEIEGRVCRVELRGQLGTGFLLGPNAVLTAYNIIEPLIAGEIEPQDAIFRFDFKRLSDGNTVDEGTEYRLAQANWLIMASPTSPTDRSFETADDSPVPEHLNFALLRLDRAAGLEPLGRWAEPGAPRRGWLEVPECEPDIQPETSLYLVFHPKGEPVKVESGVIIAPFPDSSPTRLRSRVRAGPGAAGSPCFDDQGQLIAMHHKKLFDETGTNDPDRTDEREGILLGSIVRHLTARLLAGESMEGYDSSFPGDSMPVAAEPSVSLDDEQRRLLVTRLLAAFPNLESLRDMLHQELDVNLNMISGTSENLEAVALNLVQWSEAQGMTTRLAGAINSHTSTGLTANREVQQGHLGR